MGWPAEKVRRVAESFLKLAAIATVADVVPLTGENRIIVSPRSARPGPGAQYRTARPAGCGGLHGRCGAQRAPGGLPDRAAHQCRRTHGHGERGDRTLPDQRRGARARPRQTAGRSERRAPAGASRDRGYLRADRRGDPGNARWSTTAETGIAACSGIVASRLVERLQRPVFVLGRNPDDGLASGSGRSIPAFHLLEALESMSDLFVRFGGHAHAAGVTMEAGQVEEFRRRFNAFAASASLRRRFSAPAGDRRGAGTARNHASRPSRNSSRWPRSVTATSRRCSPRWAWKWRRRPSIMKEKHLRITVRQNGRTLVLKAWNLAHRAAELVPGTRVDRGLQSGRGCLLGRPRLSAVGRHAARFPAGLRRPLQASLCRQTVRRHCG